MLQVITGKPAHGDVTSRSIAEGALAGDTDSLVDKTAGQWPLPHALAFTELGLQCAMASRRRRPDLETEILPALENLCVECSSISGVE